MCDFLRKGTKQEQCFLGDGYTLGFDDLHPPHHEKGQQVTSVNSGFENKQLISICIYIACSFVCRYLYNLFFKHICIYLHV